MSLDISSFTGKLISYVPIRQGQKPSKNFYLSGSNPAKDLEANKEQSGFAETAVLDQISFSADHKVDYEINQETQNGRSRSADPRRRFFKTDSAYRRF